MQKYIIEFCYLLFLPLFLNRIQTLSYARIVCVGLMLCSKLFGYKFILICGSVVLILNVILIIVMKNGSTHGSKSVHVD